MCGASAAACLMSWYIDLRLDLQHAREEATDRSQLGRLGRAALIVRLTCGFFLGRVYGTHPRDIVVK